MHKPNSNAGRFARGREKTGGRKAGTLNKNTVTVKDTIAMVAKRIGGEDRLVTWINETPEHETLYWTQMYMKLLPLQMNTKIERTDKVTYKTVQEFRVALIERGMPEETINSLLQLPGPKNPTKQ